MDSGAFTPWPGSRSGGVCVHRAMVLRDLIGDVLRTLWSHKLRTFLTMFGIAWGIVSIVLMVAAGEGLRKGQAEQARNLGKDILIVFHGRTSMQAGGARAGRALHWEDADVVAVQAEAADCEYAIPELEQNDVRAHSNYNNAAFTVTGSHPPFGYIRSLDVGLGRFYSWDDQKEARRVAFMGSDAAKQLFPGRNPVGEDVYLNAFPYKVIGVMAAKKQDSSYDGWDVNKIFIPFAAMHRDFPDKPPGTSTTFDQLLVTPRSVEQHEACKREVQTVLGRMHNFDPRDKEACPIWDTVQEAKAFQQMTNGMKYFLGAVGIVTLFPGRPGGDECHDGGGAGEDPRNRCAQSAGRSGPHHSQTVFYRSTADCVRERGHRDGNRVRHLLPGESATHAGLFCRPGGDLAVRSNRMCAAGHRRDFLGAVSGAQGRVH